MKVSVVTCAVILSQLALVSTAFAEAKAVSQLIENVQYWKQRGRPDKVAEVWRKVLESDPTNQQALVDLATYEAGKGHKENAERYLGRLEKLNPGNSEIPLIRRLIEMGDKYGTILTEARTLLKAKRVDEAIAKYREAFGKEPPTGAVAIEFYTTLGGTNGGWEEARAGLERLAKANPNDPRYALVYARHLTYREPTRREGITRLRELVGRSEVRADALAAWKSALGWLSMKPSDLPLYSAYIAEAGEDPQVRAMVQLLMNSKRENEALAPVRQALRQGELDKAEEMLREAAQRKNPEALVGLAQLAMQRKQFHEAVKLLQEVRRIAPHKPSLWQRFLRSAEFWEAIEQAETLRNQGKLQEAEAVLVRAVRISPSDAMHVDLLLGYIYVAQGKLDQAQKRFHAVLARTPDHVEAIRAMIDILIASKRLDEAAALNARLSKLELAAGQKAAREIGHAQAESLRLQAAIDRSSGALDKALTLLEEAQRADPDDHWVFVDLARLHIVRHQPGEAREALASLQALKPDALETKIVEVEVLAEEGRLREAFDLVNAIPSDQSNVDLLKLKRSLHIRLTISDALVRSQEGRSEESRRLLEELQKELANDDDELTNVVFAWSRVGETGRALKLMRQILGRSRVRRVTRQLQLAAILLRSGRYDELATLLDDVARQPQLSPQESHDLVELRMVLAVHQANVVRTDGDPRRALRMLRPLVEEQPDEPRVRVALGWMLVDLEEFPAAMASFRHALEKDPKNFEAREGAVSMALRLGREDEAARLVSQGFEIAPDSPQAELLAARLAAARGNDAKAMKSLRHAKSMIEAKRPVKSPTLRLIDERTGELDIDEFDLPSSDSASSEDDEGRTRSRAAPMVEQQVDKEMAEVAARHAGDLVVEPLVRYRDGSSGAGQLMQVAALLSLSVPTGFYGRLRLTVSPMVLYAGTLAVMDPAFGDRFGRIGTVTLDPGNNPITEMSWGVGFDLSYAYRGLTLFVGSTPLGFPLWTMTGGATWYSSFGGFEIGLGAARRSVTDSLLSYSGAIDPVSNRAWGMVTANGLRLDLGYHHGPMRYYVFGGYEWLLGTHVQQNQRGFGGLGLRWRLANWSGLALYSGISLGMMTYANNLRYFTYGQGGYFSPQMFINGGVPLILEGERGNFSVRAEAEFGINWFREDGSAYYPLDADLQAIRQGRVDPTTQPPTEAWFSSKTSLSMMVNLRAQLAYRLSSQLIVGADLAFHTAADYQEFIGCLFIAWGFKPGSAPHMPVIPPL